VNRAPESVDRVATQTLDVVLFDAVELAAGQLLFSHCGYLPLRERRHLGCFGYILKVRSVAALEQAVDVAVDRKVRMPKRFTEM
jgi:hypothetical protein